MDPKLYRESIILSYFGALALLFTLMAMSGCAAFKETPPTFAPFPLNDGFMEAKADPGRVLDERIKFGSTKAGERHGYPVLCGFVDFVSKIVWVARDYNCPPTEETRRHENCHIEARERGIKDECHDGRKF